MRGKGAMGEGQEIVERRGREKLRWWEGGDEGGGRERRSEEWETKGEEKNENVSGRESRKM